MTKEALTQLREVHAIQGRDGCWDIDDYMLGLYNGLELALSIMENRECRYKQRPKSQPKQEPVAWMFQHDETGRMTYVGNDGIHDPTMFLEMNPRYALVCPLYTSPTQRKPLTDDEILAVNMSTVTKLIDEPIIYDTNHNIIQLGKAIDAKLKQKNGYAEEKNT